VAVCVLEASIRAFVDEPLHLLHALVLDRVVQCRLPASVALVDELLRVVYAAEL